MEERLNKVLARADVASRRKADEMIAAGRITVNGQVVTELGRQVDPEHDEILVDGERLPLTVENYRYFALYKPRHVITTTDDPFDRPTVLDFVDPDIRLFPVGRLDGASEGLVLLTNDGPLANQLTHPRYEHEKEYRVHITGAPSDKALQLWRDGIWLEDGRTLPARVTIDKRNESSTWIRLVLREGRNRQIRRMVEAMNYRVLRLVRVRLGPIKLGPLKAGQWRELSPDELAALRRGDSGVAEEVVESKSKKRYKEGWARPKAHKDIRKGRSPRRSTVSPKRGPRKPPR